MKNTAYMKVVEFQFENNDANIFQLDTEPIVP